MRRRSDVVVNHVNVLLPGDDPTNWNMPLLREHGVSATPYLQIYDPSGTLVEKVGGEPARQKVEELISSGSR